MGVAHPLSRCTLAGMPGQARPDTALAAGASSRL